MRNVLVIGIGAGNPDFMTVQAIDALNRTDVFFVLDKGEPAADLNAIRETICRRFITGNGYRVVKAPQPKRDREREDYKDGVDSWHADVGTVFEELIRDELTEGQTGAFLVWGDPAFYDSTIRILQQILGRDGTLFDYRVIPGISSAQALAASHRVPLNRIGEPVTFTTGRRVASGFDTDSVVWLDSGSGLRALRDENAEIFWGAYLGTPDEVLVSGRLKDVADEILRIRDEMRCAKGWIMDTYLLRRES